MLTYWSAIVPRWGIWCLAMHKKPHLGLFGLFFCSRRSCLEHLVFFFVTDAPVQEAASVSSVTNLFIFPKPLKYVSGLFYTMKKLEETTYELYEELLSPDRSYFYSAAAFIFLLLLTCTASYSYGTSIQNHGGILVFAGGVTKRSQVIVFIFYRC